MRFVTCFRTVLLGSLLCHLAAPADAQDNVRAFALQEQLTPFAELVQRTLGGQYDRFRDTLDELVAQEIQQRSFTGELGFSFSGDEAGTYSGVGPGNDTLFRLRTTAEASRGTYPARVSFLADVNAQIRNNVVDQDVSRFRISYDYQQTDYTGYFAYVERQTDNFMSIASRYEVGAGVSFGISLFPRRVDERGARALSHLTSGGPSSFPCAVDRLRQTFHAGSTVGPRGCSDIPAGPLAVASGPRPVIEVFDQMQAVVPHLRRALRAQESWLFLSLGLGVFTELENAIMETRVSEFVPEAFEPKLEPSPVVEGPVVPLTELPQHVRELPRRSVQLPGMYRYRLLLWPTLRVRPLSSVSINFIPSFKLPINEPRRFNDGVLAYRMDWYVRIDWRLRQDADGGERVKLFVKFDYYKNMGPPEISDDLIAAAALEHLVYHRTSASKKHRIASFGVAVKLGA